MSRRGKPLVKRKIDPVETKELLMTLVTSCSDYWLVVTLVETLAVSVGFECTATSQIKGMAPTMMGMATTMAQRINTG